MKYINNIRTGFTVEINEETGNFSGILRTGKYHKKDKTFSGNINTMTDYEKLCMEGILESAFPEMRMAFCNAYTTLLPNFSGLIVLV